jgi:hypothetical protein
MKLVFIKKWSAAFLLAATVVTTTSTAHAHTQLVSQPSRSHSDNKIPVKFSFAYGSGVARTPIAFTSDAHEVRCNPHWSGCHPQYKKLSPRKDQSSQATPSANYQVAATKPSKGPTVSSQLGLADAKSSLMESDKKLIAYMWQEYTDRIQHKSHSLNLESQIRYQFRVTNYWLEQEFKQNPSAAKPYAKQMSKVLAGIKPYSLYTPEHTAYFHERFKYMANAPSI